jgi:hypothetical protein
VAPFFAVVLLFAWSIGQFANRSRYFVVLTTALFCGASVLVDSAIEPYFQRIFFVASGRVAEAAKHDLLSQMNTPQSSLGLIVGLEHCNWTLAHGQFFKFYGAASDAIVCLDSVYRDEEKRLSPITKIWQYRDGRVASFRDVTADWHAAHDIGTHKLSFDFLSAYSTGRISNPVEVQTPSGRGAMLASWPTDQLSHGTLTILSGFGYRYDGIAIQKGARLLFGIGMIFPAPEPAMATIQIIDSVGRPTIIYSRILSPPETAEVRTFEPISINLDQFAGMAVSVIFTVSTPGRDSTAHWIGFAEPRILCGDKP